MKKQVFERAGSRRGKVTSRLRENRSGSARKGSPTGWWKPGANPITEDTNLVFPKSMPLIPPPFSVAKIKIKSFTALQWYFMNQNSCVVLVVVYCGFVCFWGGWCFCIWSAVTSQAQTSLTLPLQPTHGSVSQEDAVKQPTARKKQPCTT